MRKIKFVSNLLNPTDSCRPHHYVSAEKFEICPGEKLLFVLDNAQVMQRLVLQDLELCEFCETPKIEQLCILVHNLSFSKTFSTYKEANLQSILQSPWLRAIKCRVDYNELVQSSNKIVLHQQI